eukprot:TRINITY_DN1644_c0_g1_i2.p1 TRINITY_DN1644_c0_g1~~TRINITY_DN1644_c0_g1_i2.p1  ORF type:complete len:360 (+),score=107.96 TRINITY_DN1644_c0_g1_i2:54-1082(+)
MADTEDLALPLSTNPDFRDVVPIPQDDGPSPVVPISYGPEFTDVMNYFRAFLKSNEKSERAFKLTTEVIRLNSANYTAWQYRRACLFELGKDLYAELQFVAELAEDTPKNYQLWYHRRALIEKLCELNGVDSFDWEQELEHTARILLEDAKNYHVWSHRQWLVTRSNFFRLEFPYINFLLEQDLRNNSAWNHRHFVISKTEQWDEAVIARELEFTFPRIARAAGNESAWNYIRGLLGKPHFSATHLESLEKFLRQLLSSPASNEALAEPVPASPAPLDNTTFLMGMGFAQGVLVDVLERTGRIASAIEGCSLLEEQYDVCRAAYWRYRRLQLVDRLQNSTQS